MPEFVCKQKEKCDKGCVRRYARPDYDKLSENAYTVEFCGIALEVAAEDIVGVNGEKFWSFSDAQEISRQIEAESGWRLPTPAEMQMIIGYAAWCDDSEHVTSEVLKEELCLEMNGFGNVRDDCTPGCAYAREKGETGLYWTNSMKPWPEENVCKIPSGVVLKLKYGLGFMDSAIIDEIKASVRLVRDVK